MFQTSILPFDIIGIVMDSETVERLKILRVIRLFRLVRVSCDYTAAFPCSAAFLTLLSRRHQFKLFRIFRASRIFSRWETYISVSYSWLSLIKFIVAVGAVSHWVCSSAQHSTAQH